MPGDSHLSVSYFLLVLTPVLDKWYHPLPGAMTEIHSSNGQARLLTSGLASRLAFKFNSYSQMHSVDNHYGEHRTSNSTFNIQLQLVFTNAFS